MDEAAPFLRQSFQTLPAKPENEFFANALDDCLLERGSSPERRTRILNLVDTYYHYASEQYHNRIRRRKQKARSRSAGGQEETDMDVDDVDEQAGSNTSAEEIRNWKQEASTWDLLRRLLPIRYPEIDSRANRSSRLTPRSSHQGLWHEFVGASDPLVKERKAVLQWLQTGAADGPDINDLVEDLQKNADRGDIIAHGWIHSKSLIKLRKSVGAWPHVLDPSSPEVAQSLLNSSKSPLVTQLDPDSITRQGRKLEPQDEYFERAVWRGCFELLRRGCTPEEIREWCSERTEGWRVVSMSALCLSREDTNIPPEVPPESFSIWRRCCLAASRQGGSDDYERAVYGILSGDLPAVERVCKTWDDFVFAHYNAHLRSQFDSFVSSRCSQEADATIAQQALPSFDATQNLDDTGKLEKRLVRSLESNSATAAEARDPVKALQGSILANELEQHFFDQGSVLALHMNDKLESKLLPRNDLSGSNVDSRRYFQPAQSHGVRVAAHVYIILSQLEALYPETTSAISHDTARRDVQQNAVATYISLLRLSGLHELIPLYCSTLQGPRQYEVLCRNLISIVDEDTRQREMNLIHQAGLDPLKFVKTLAVIQSDAALKLGGGRESTNPVFSILEDVPHSTKYGRPVQPDFFSDDPEQIDPAHEHLIRAVEWLTLAEYAWPEVLSTGTKVYKYFLKQMHLNAARAFSERISFSELLKTRIIGPGDDEPEATELSSTGFWAAHLNAMPAFVGTPAQVAADARNFRELEGLVRALDTMETLASMAQISREGSAKSPDFWPNVGIEAKALSDHMQPLLGGWLLVGIQEGDSELARLRQTYLPETVLAYVSTLHFAGTCLSRDYLLESMELASVVADKNSDIATCFVEARRMKELVESFALCSKALAVTTGEKKASGSSSKKLREAGWSRELWSVKPATARR
ncbi:related to nuclear pore protein [Cephalotrichum gorgonifer]|uniref:Nuclear pore complex protein n=1 Tax=Cephalotrichum gorgonifer TaxID=2041049 RepID=A0AAE8SWZ3_9PEZI|nr:related to nuclear pore protein [Cephalotrichum gorgonifer]